MCIRDRGIPPYNGGLFDRAATPILARVQLPDNVLAKVIFGPVSYTHLDVYKGQTYWETVGKQAQDENLQRFANQSGVPFDDVSTDRAKILPLLHRGLLAMIAELDAKKTELEALELSEAPVATKDRATTLPDIDGAGKTVAEVVELYVSCLLYTSRCV